LSTQQHAYSDHKYLNLIHTYIRSTSRLQLSGPKNKITFHTLSLPMETGNPLSLQLSPFAFIVISVCAPFHSFPIHFIVFLYIAHSVQSALVSTTKSIVCPVLPPSAFLTPQRISKHRRSTYPDYYCPSESSQLERTKSSSFATARQAPPYCAIPGSNRTRKSSKICA